jgi:uncharacterized protein with ParB-like and HNH nuclease domain
MLEELLDLPVEPEDISLPDIAIEEDDPIEFTYSMTWYGADYTVDGLVKRIYRDDIYIPKFQRSYVWDIKQASRFIESLLLGLPVPGIFLAKEEDTKKLIVIDGNQRLRTLAYFYKGTFDPSGKAFKLIDVQKKFTNATYDSLSSEDRRQLDDSILHATIVKQDEPSNDDSSIYLIFERLNTGGKILAPQEVRSCIYHGDFKEVLAELNMNKSWRAIYNTSNIFDKRLRDEELILRFMALFDLHQEYRKPMKNFLNEYMRDNKKANTNLIIKKELFVKTIELIHRSVGDKAFKIRKHLNAAVFDAVMVGLATRLVRGDITQEETLKEIYDDLIQNKEFLTFIDTARTTDNLEVQGRIKIAIKAFAEVL